MHCPAFDSPVRVCATLVYLCVRYPLLLLQTTQKFFSEVHAVRAA